MQTHFYCQPFLPFGAHHSHRAPKAHNCRILFYYNCNSQKRPAWDCDLASRSESCAVSLIHHARNLDEFHFQKEEERRHCQEDDRQLSQSCSKSHRVCLTTQRGIDWNQRFHAWTSPPSSFSSSFHNARVFCRFMGSIC